MAWQRLRLQSWLSSHWRWPQWYWAVFNLTALIIYAYIFTQGQSAEAWHQTSEGFDSMMESGKWGIRFLLLCLTMTPLHTFLRWSSALKLRKSAGLWAFAFGATHFGLYAIESWEPYPAYWQSGTPWHWLTWPMQLYIALGLISLLILTALAVTSNRWSMRRLGKNWKWLHRLVYCAGVAILCHALLAAEMSKKMTVLDPEAVTELRIYLGVLAVLLLIRVPQVRFLLLKRVAVARPQQRTVVPIAPKVIPIHTPPPPQWTTPHPQDPVIMLDELADVTDTELSSSSEREAVY